MLCEYIGGLFTLKVISLLIVVSTTLACGKQFYNFVFGSRRALSRLKK